MRFAALFPIDWQPRAHLIALRAPAHSSFPHGERGADRNNEQLSALDKPPRPRLGHIDLTGLAFNRHVLRVTQDKLSPSTPLVRGGARRFRCEIPSLRQYAS